MLGKTKLYIKRDAGLRQNIRALLGYIFLTAVLTYPLIFKINNQIMDYGAWDSFGTQGVLWWFDKAIFELGVNPLHTNYFHYPIGIDITNCGIIWILLLPITHVFGAIVSYNMYVLLTFIIAGFGTYLLVKYLTNDMRASFIAGIVYAFSPYHFSHAMGHISIMSIQWIPLYVLFLMKMIRDKRRLDTCLCAIFFSLTALSSWTLAIYALIFSVLYIIYVLYTDREFVISYSFLKEFMVFGIISAVLITPFALVLVKNMLTNPQMYKPLTDFVIYSADVLGFVLPSPMHTLFGEYTYPIYRHFTGNIAENTTYIGYTVLMLSFFAIWKIRTKYIGFLVFSSLIFFILSLGPVLHINGIFTIPVSGLNIDSFVRSIGIQLPDKAFDVLSSHLAIPLPGLALHYMPILSMARCPNRIVVMLMLMLAILVGYGISEILKGIKNTNKQQIFCIVIGLLIIFEFLSIPLPMSSATAPDFYHQMSNDKEDYAVVELPMGYSPPASSYLPIYPFYQSIHGKKLVGGTSSREGAPFREFVKRTPVLQKLWQFNTSEDDILNQNLSVIGQSVLTCYNIRYVIVHYDLFSSIKGQVIISDYSIRIYPRSQRNVNVTNEYKNKAERILSQIFGNESYYKEGEMVVYKVKKDNLAPFMMLGNNWHEVEIWQGSPFRLMSNNATIQIINPTNETMEAELKFVVTSIYQPRTLILYIDNTRIDSYNISAVYPNKTNISTPAITIRPGSNIVKLYTPECGVVDDDSKEVSMGFQNVRLIKVVQYQ